MNKTTLNTYSCPVMHEQLLLSNEIEDVNGLIISGTLTSASGHKYRIDDGIPDFTWPDVLRESDSHSKEEYNHTSEEIYDNSLDWLFEFFHEDEQTLRESMVDLLNIKPDSRVLEIGCGTGRDTIHIARRLNKGLFYIQDLSGRMVRKCRDNIKKFPFSQTLNVEFFVGNGAYLPFPDKYFDAVFHFGGINEFSEKEKAFNEISRVVRRGGKVVIGDESIAPWLREKEYGKILINNNRLIAHDIPLELLPENSKQVCVRWILGNAYYVMDYVVDDGLPSINLDLPHKGKRGGTCRTRYFGQLEGVTVQTKQLAQLAVENLGISMHEWLDAIVRQNAEKVLKSQ